MTMTTGATNGISPDQYSPFDPRQFDRLGDEQVIRRIGALLAKALLRSRQQGAARALLGQPAKAPASTVNPLELLRDDTARQVVSFLQCAGPTSPAMIGRTLGIPQRVITRRLTRLRASGVCEVEGKTRAVRYRVRDDFSVN
jgi:DNA-binding Lrp family transcriptional regulator